jgi:Lar family restriction alleviation protein
MTDLLPCPFCGSDAAVVESNDRFYVACNGDDCFTCVGEAHDIWGEPAHIFTSEEAAVEAWNRRAA